MVYAVAFGKYASTFIPQDQQSVLLLHVLISLGIILPTIVNLFGAEIISKTEIYIVGFKIAILVIVIVLGFGSVDPTPLEPGMWKPLTQIVSAGMIIFVAYEGFELIANTADDVRNYRVSLPRAYYISVVFVIILYTLIAIVVVGSLSPGVIASSQDFVLAEAAKPSLGQLGFTMVGVAAVLATLSAINSTLYGSARLSYTIASEGELPKALEKKVWSQPIRRSHSSLGLNSTMNIAATVFVVPEPNPCRKANTIQNQTKRVNGNIASPMARRTYPEI